MKKGPEIKWIVRESCHQCCFLRVHLHKSGLNPTYKYFCNHEDLPEALRYLGESDETPENCPEKKDHSSEISSNSTKKD